MNLAKRNSQLFVLLMAVAFTTLAVIGCGGGSGGSSSDSGGGTTPPATSPNISLSTQQLLFGNVIPNAVVSSADRSVTVTNTGTANLVMSQIDPAALSPPFEILNDNCSGTSVAPNGSCSVKVRFKPTSISLDTYTDSFAVTSNDPDQPSLTVSVSGDAKGLNVTINKVDTSLVTAAGGPVKLLVSVTDGSNTPVASLLQGNFTVTEEGAGKQFTVSPNLVNSPVSASLVLDNSLSTDPVQPIIKQTAKDFIASLETTTDEAEVIKFAAEVHPAIQFTALTPPSNITLINAGIDAEFPYEKNATKLYDAVDLAVNNLLGRKDRRCAIVVSDGEDIINSVPASTADLDTVIFDAQDNKVFIFTIGLGDIIIRDVMQRMAAETGGQYFEAQPDGNDLDAIYQQISVILGNQYEITFTTAKALGSTNSLKVVATDPTALTGEDTESVVY
jgi:VWFA-related protein